MYFFLALTLFHLLRHISARVQLKHTLSRTCIIFCFHRIIIIISRLIVAPLTSDQFGLFSNTSKAVLLFLFLFLFLLLTWWSNSDSAFITSSTSCFFFFNFFYCYCSYCSSAGRCWLTSTFRACLWSLLLGVWILFFLRDFKQSRQKSRTCCLVLETRRAFRAAAAMKAAWRHRGGALMSRVPAGAPSLYYPSGGDRYSAFIHFMAFITTPQRRNKRFVTLIVLLWSTWNT